MNIEITLIKLKLFMNEEDITWDVSNITWNVSNINWYVSDIRWDLYDCEITKMDLIKWKINISDLII